MHKKKFTILFLILSLTLPLTSCNNPSSTVSNSQIKNKQDTINSATLKEWGLGENLTESVSNDRDYEWYINQNNTGTYSCINCVPACATMAIKWANKDFDKSVEVARNTYILKYNCLKGWNTDYAKEYITENGIKCFTSRDISKNALKNTIKEGNIALIFMATKYLTVSDSSKKHVDSFYPVGGHHAIIIKGYKIVDNNLYFEVYDPDGSTTNYIGNPPIGITCKNKYCRARYNSDIASVSYSDGSPAGKNRYYRADEVVTGMLYSSTEYYIIDGSKYDFFNKTKKGKVVKIRDSHLEKAIRQKLLKPYGDIYERDVEKITSLKLYDSKVATLKGIENLKNLEDLNISNTDIFNSDIYYLGKLKNLTFLDMKCTNITNIKFLMKPNNLKEVYIPYKIKISNEELISKIKRKNPNIEIY